LGTPACLGLRGYAELEWSNDFLNEPKILTVITQIAVTWKITMLFLGVYEITLAGT